MFEQALEGLLLQKRKEKTVAATGSTSRTVDGGDGDGVPPGDGVGWVDVVRRVSEIAVSFGSSFLREDLRVIHEKV